MTVGLDTSVLVRLLTGDPRDLAVAALHDLQERKATGGRVLVSDLVLAETYYALQYHYGVTKKEVLDALRRFLATPGIEGAGEGAHVLQTPKLQSVKPGFLDRVIYQSYVRAGAEQVVTFEKAARRLPHVVVLAS